MPAARKIRQQGCIFVIGMRADHHHGAHGRQLLQGLADGGLAGNAPLGLSWGKRNRAGQTKEKQTPAARGFCR
jgi:hypothetical protein